GLAIATACARPTPAERINQTPAGPPVNPFRGGGDVSTTIPARHAPSLSPSPAYPGRYSGTPTPNPTPVGYTPGTGVESYVVQPGQTLGWIAQVFGCTVEEIAAANNLADMNNIAAGQTLIIPVNATEFGPPLKLVPDSEMVYGPAYVGFDLAGFVAAQGGYLAGYTEEVEGKVLTGADIVHLVSRRFSVGPRVLLTLLELRSGWVTDPQPAAGTLTYPLGYAREYYEGLFRQLSWAASSLNEGYYGWKWRGRGTVRLGDGTRVAVAPVLNPGSVGVQNALAGLSSSLEEWHTLVGPTGFPATYERLFGNPFAYAVEPLVPPDLVQPALCLPWETGQVWYFTGGPHGGWGNDNDRAALDFVPGERQLGCAPSSAWATAAASGLVVRSEDGELVLDLDGDGFEQSGWVLFYLHLYSEGRVEAGTYVQRGQRLGRPSCEGGYSTATHLHFARRYNGEWIPAGEGSAPLVLSGWVARGDVMPYEGTLTRGHEVRTACECWEDEFNGLLSECTP
ncbi:MAG: LysM peptidoglycan-binding domain-containing M23 family metallopeptidase, partial [Anaerolineae bacterium]|nr:LysM peptidoglycan-binding domain-containing M23 family metallopeptidase [Anaerolineae bacterium]